MCLDRWKWDEQEQESKNEAKDEIRGGRNGNREAKYFGANNIWRRGYGEWREMI
jgi:hypothetical protein